MIVLGLSDERSDHLVDVSVVDLLQDREGFTWKGHDRLEPRLKPAPFPPGFQPLVLVQCLPPASVTAVALHAEWNLISFGTSHGFGLFDYHRRNAVLARLLNVWFLQVEANLIGAFSLLSPCCSSHEFLMV